MRPIGLPQDENTKVNFQMRKKEEKEEERRKGKEEMQKCPCKCLKRSLEKENVHLLFKFKK